MITTHCGNTTPHGRHDWRPDRSHVLDYRFCEGTPTPRPGANEAAEQAADHLAHECELLAGRLNTVARHARERRYGSIDLPEVGLRGTEIDIYIALLKDRLGQRITLEH